MAPLPRSKSVEAGQFQPSSFLPAIELALRPQVQKRPVAVKVIKSEPAAALAVSRSRQQRHRSLRRP